MTNPRRVASARAAGVATGARYRAAVRRVRDELDAIETEADAGDETARAIVARIRAALDDAQPIPSQLTNTPQEP